MPDLSSGAEQGSGASVLGLDNVRVELPVAGVGNRALAAFLDHVVLGLGMVVVVIVLIAAAAATERPGWALVVALFVLFLVNWGYFVALEIAMEGQTLGKKALGLRVVSRDGGRPSPGALVVRNLFRVVDNFVGIFLIAADTQARRLGDRLAGTLVVHQPRVRQRLVVGRAPAGWGAKEVAVAESLLARAATLEPEQVVRFAGRMIAWIERDDPALLDSLPPDADPMRRLRLALRVESL